MRFPYAPVQRTCEVASLRSPATARGGQSRELTPGAVRAARPLQQYYRRLAEMEKRHLKRGVPL